SLQVGGALGRVGLLQGGDVDRLFGHGRASLGDDGSAPPTMQHPRLERLTNFQVFPPRLRVAASESPGHPAARPADHFPSWTLSLSLHSAAFAERPQAS